jgi:hypothetical protein
VAALPAIAAASRAVFQQVAQGHDESQSQAVADLRQRDDQAGGARLDAGGPADRADQRLGVIQVGDNQAAGNGQQQDHCGGDVMLLFHGGAG